MGPNKFILKIDGDDHGYKRGELTRLAGDIARFFDRGALTHKALIETLTCIRDLSDYGDQVITFQNNITGKTATVTAFLLRASQQ